MKTKLTTEQIVARYEKSKVTMQKSNIRQRIILGKAKSAGLTASDAEVDAYKKAHRL